MKAHAQKPAWGTPAVWTLLALGVTVCLCSGTLQADDVSIFFTEAHVTPVSEADALLAADVELGAALDLKAWALVTSGDNNSVLAFNQRITSGNTDIVELPLQVGSINATVWEQAQDKGSTSDAGRVIEWIQGGTTNIGYGLTVPIELYELSVTVPISATMFDSTTVTVDGTPAGTGAILLDNFAPVSLDSKSLEITAVPEPVSLVLMGAGALALLRRRKARRR